MPNKRVAFKKLINGQIQNLKVVDDYGDTQGFNRIELSGGIDLNDIILNTGEYTSVFYRCSYKDDSIDIANKPITNNNPFLLDAESLRYINEVDYITKQTFKPLGDTLSDYVRFCTNGIWSAWKKKEYTDTLYSAGDGIIISGTTIINSGVRSISTGSDNGTISVNTNGITKDIPVKGLKSAAYTESSAYATANHNHDNIYAPKSHTHNYAGSKVAGGAANSAINDNAGQKIDSTYIKNLSVDGKVITYTRGDGSTGNITTQDTNTVYTHPTTSGNKHIPSGGSSGKFLKWSADGTAVWANDNNTTYSNFVKSGSGAKSGLVPSPPTTAGTTKYLREDGTWNVPPNTNTDTKVTQTNTTTAADYRLVLSANANDTTETNTTKKSSKFKANPSTGELFSDYFCTSGNIATDDRHSRFRDGSIDTYVPTSNNFTCGLNYYTNSGTHLGCIGAFGSAGTAEFYFMGGTFSEPWLKVDSAKNVTANTFKGSLSGNASAATKLQTARTINGVSFDGSKDITIPRNNKSVHVASGTTGTNGYIKICTLKVIAKYANHSVRLTVTQRCIPHYDIVFQFYSTSNVDPAPHLAYYVGYEGTPLVYYVKSATSTYDIYIRKTEGYDHIYILDYLKADGNEGVNYTLTFTDTQVSSLPSGYVKLSNALGTMAKKNADNYLEYKQQIIFKGDYDPKIIGYTSIDIDGLFTKYKLLHIELNGNKYGSRNYIVPVDALFNNNLTYNTTHKSSDKATVDQITIRKTSDNSMEWFEFMGSGAEKYTSVLVIGLY